MKKPISTIAIYRDDRATWQAWCKAKGLNSADFIAAFIRHVKLHKQREFYNSLPMPNGYKRPLEGKYIEKRKLNTEIYEKQGHH